MTAHLDDQIILVVGGTGFLGHHLIEDLLERGAKPGDLHVLDIKLDGDRVTGVTYHQADISSSEDVKHVLETVKPSVLFHTAAPYPFESNRQIQENVNITGTRNLIDVAKLIGSITAFVYISSSSVVHDHFHPLVYVDETSPVVYHPQQPNYYSHTKAVAERIVLAANRDVGNMLTVAVRPASMYGEADNLQVPNLVKNAKAGRANLQIGAGDNKFDNTYVRNITFALILAAQALVHAAEAEPLPKDQRVEGEAFFVTDDDPYTFAGHARLAAEFAGYPVKSEEIRSIPIWFILPLVYVLEWLYWICTLGKEMTFSTKVVRMIAQERTFDITKIKTRLGYRPLFTTAQGTKRAVEWYLEHQESGNGGKKGQ